MCQSKINLGRKISNSLSFTWKVKTMFRHCTKDLREFKEYGTLWHAILDKCQQSHMGLLRCKSKPKTINEKKEFKDSFGLQNVLFHVQIFYFYLPLTIALWYLNYFDSVFNEDPLKVIYYEFLNKPVARKDFSKWIKAHLHTKFYHLFFTLIKGQETLNVSNYPSVRWEQISSHYDWSLKATLSSFIWYRGFLTNWFIVAGKNVLCHSSCCEI